ncbi:hypothetical protein ACFXTH_040292 [Malus domestica]
MRVEGHMCLAIEDKDIWLLVDRVFEDESLVLSTGAEISEVDNSYMEELWWCFLNLSWGKRQSLRMRMSWKVRSKSGLEKIM